MGSIQLEHPSKTVPATHSATVRAGTLRVILGAGNGYTTSDHTPKSVMSNFPSNNWTFELVPELVVVNGFSTLVSNISLIVREQPIEEMK